ncbi:hypothetical protein V494_02402 [Pseudogymnoascus sp. VKM F-4513 (FW-928)]|nr:hypothetical protein V494_02402 [Pseudogymnoascus sp. VKM F-4513 (FW-928)]
MCELYEVDPDGDLVIILSSTDAAFAPWNDPNDELTVSSDSLETDFTVNIACSQVTIVDERPSTSDASPPSVHFKVSSKHLSLASRRFKKMLSGDWEEAKRIYEDGCRHVTLDDGFDSDAVKLLLDIIHGQTSKVPRSLDLEMLAKVSVLVDDFECYEAVGVFVDIWLEHLPIPLPAEYNRDLVLWMLVSSVFRKPKLFESTTRTAIMHSIEPIQTLGLPVRDIIVAKIDEERQSLLNQLIETVHDVLDKLRSSQPLCGFECDSILLGAMVQQLYPHNLIWPKPLEPFIGFGFVETAETVRSLRSPAWCDMLVRATATRESEDEEMYFGTKKTKGKHRSPWEEVAAAPEVQECPQHACTLRDLLVPELDHLEQSIGGLDLEKI